MAYIGRDISNLSDRAKLDAITTSATATFNLTLNSVAYVPSSAESLTVSLNGVIQAPQSSYTVSNATIVFASNLASSDVIDFILAERAITLTTIGSGTVNTSNIVDDAGTYAKTDGTFGKIGQVLHTDTTTQVSTTSATFAQYTQLNRTITPTSTSSKILVQVSLSFFLLGSNYNDAGFQITQGGTSIANYGFGGYKPNSTSALAFSPVFLQTLHSPSSTSELTYGVKYNQPQGSETLILTYQGASTGEQQRSSITVMEVLA